jgi:hypothetical protein
MNHTNASKWIIVAIIAMLLLVVIAYSIQKPEQFTNIPFLGPTATPTPLSSGNIILTSPRFNEHVGQQFTIIGKARVFENVVSIRLKDKLSGKIYGEVASRTDAQDAGQFGDFQTGVLLNDPKLQPGTELLLEVYQASPKDGQEIDKLVVPLIFTPTAD